MLRGKKLNELRGRRLAVIGQGYVGLPLAVRAAERGWETVGVDVSAERVAALRAGRSCTPDISDARLAEVTESGALTVTAEIKAAQGFDYAVITVPTPLRDGIPDLGHVRDACLDLAPYVTRGSTVILESTTYPGTTEEVVKEILERVSGLTAGEDFALGYSPERCDPGNPTYDIENTPKIVSGYTPACAESVRAFYATIVSRPVPVESLRLAEFAKILENTFRYVNIGLVNELALLARDLDLDIWKAIDAAGTKPFGYMPFRPGPGVGGHCLPVDPLYLTWRMREKLGATSQFIELAHKVNSGMPAHVVDRLAYALKEREIELAGARVLLLGLAYKPNTGDLRESPSLVVARLLAERGADVRCCDPHVDAGALPADLTLAEAGAAEAARADAVVVLVDHEAFDLPGIVGAAPYVLDCRCAVRGANVEVM